MHTRMLILMPTNAVHRVDVMYALSLLKQEVVVRIVFLQTAPGKVHACTHFNHALHLSIMHSTSHVHCTICCPLWLCRHGWRCAPHHLLSVVSTPSAAAGVAAAVPAGVA